MPLDSVQLNLSPLREPREGIVSFPGKLLDQGQDKPQQTQRSRAGGEASQSKRYSTRAVGHANGDGANDDEKGGDGQKQPALIATALGTPVRGLA